MLKLSEAIRLGSMLKPQARGHLFRHGGSCALGAAYDASGLAHGADEDGYLPAEVHQRARAQWPVLTQVVRCPSCLSYATSCRDMITHLNDIHRWTREAIAEWVATMDGSEPQATPLERDHVCCR